MILKQFTIGSLENNNYLLIDEKSKEAVLIDCTQDCEDIDNTLKEYGAKLKYILLTHGHFDHILGVNNFKRKYDCKVLLHEADKTLADSVTEFVKNFGIDEADVQEIDEYIRDNQIIKFGENSIKVIHTPGHTKGGVCYFVGDKLFSGDTLFYESVGRTDLPDGNFAQIKSSIEERLFKLDDNIKVYAGHGPSTTIGHEKANNQFL
ncbi:MAG: MBL fold metallo-hydrolase [bacterium]